MKIEIDIDELRKQALNMKAMREADGDGITATIRQWGIYNEALADIPDEFLIENVEHQLKAKIKEMYAYAPDVSDIKIEEVKVITDYLKRRKIARGHFYYASPIFDYWYHQIEDAKASAKANGERGAYYDIAKEMLDECECDGNCFHSKVLDLMKKKLDLDDDYNWDWLNY